MLRYARNDGGAVCTAGKATGSRERAPDDRLRVPTIVCETLVVGTAHGRFAHPTLRFRQLNFRARCSKKRLKGRNSPTNPKKPPQGAIK